METSTYIDLAGIKHDIQVTTGAYHNQTYYRIYRDGIYFCDLVKVDGEWQELFGGPTPRATEYGGWLDSVVVK